MKYSTALMAACLCAGALAHMELIQPAAIDSKFAGTPVNSDSYSMTSPLKQDGSMYPCRGPNYLNNPALLTPRTTWTAGQNQTIKFANTVSHFGGSCQYALSYDMGKTFNVFWSEMGGCMIEAGSQNDARLEHQIPLPQDVPNGNNVLFAWYWQARNAGSPEAYHDCAVINIAGGSNKIMDEKIYPPPWTGYMEANGCGYERNTEIVYPRPGLNHVFGGSLEGGTMTAEQTTRGTNCEHKGGGMKSLPAYNGPAAPPAGQQGQAQGQQGQGQQPEQGQGQQGQQGQAPAQSPAVAAGQPAASSQAGEPAAALPQAGSTGLPADGSSSTNAFGTNNAVKPCRKVRRRRRRSTVKRGMDEARGARRSRMQRDDKWERAVQQIRREERWSEDLEALARRTAGL